MKSWTTPKFDEIRQPTAELAALERLEKSPYTYTGKMMSPFFSRLLIIQSFCYLQVMRTCIRALMSLNFCQI